MQIERAEPIEPDKYRIRDDAGMLVRHDDQMPMLFDSRKEAEEWLALQKV